MRINHTLKVLLNLDCPQATALAEEYHTPERDNIATDLTYDLVEVYAHPRKQGQHMCAFDVRPGACQWASAVASAPRF